jgi:hypothetical protein
MVQRCGPKRQQLGGRAISDPHKNNLRHTWAMERRPDPSACCTVIKAAAHSVANTCPQKICSAPQHMLETSLRRNDPA